MFRTYFERDTKGFFVEDLMLVDCANVNDMIAVLNQGMKHRKIGSHELNKDSSRSHSILTIYIVTEMNVGGQSLRKLGKISFVDLAGSERLKESKSQGTMVKETQQINKSLFTLGKVISALSDKKNKNPYIPYRDSKLTMLLMDSLGYASSLHQRQRQGTDDFVRVTVRSILRRDSEYFELRNEDDEREKQASDPDGRQVAVDIQPDSRERTPAHGEPVSAGTAAAGGERPACGDPTRQFRSPGKQGLEPDQPRQTAALRRQAVGIGQRQLPAALQPSTFTVIKRW
jgi:hypothetical protein